MEGLFKQHLKEQFSFLYDKKLLIACSGGLDSMVLTHLCKDAGLHLGLAHCNFNLRGDDSDGDAQFVQAYGTQHQIPVFVKAFDTPAFAKISKTSTQVTARNLRYEWFESLCAAEGYDYILTAHHANDSLETMLINFGRGTGIDGLLGIPAVNGKTVRVLLPFSRKHIEAYARAKEINWREDKSNATDDYVRNHLRHHAIPAWEEAIPNVLAGASKTIKYLKETKALLDLYAAQLRQEMTYPIDAISDLRGLALDCSKIKAHAAPKAVLYTLLHPYGFTAWDDIVALLDGQSGKQIFSTSHRLLKNREVLALYKIEENDGKIYTWERDIADVSGDFGVLVLDSTNAIEASSKNEIVVVANQLHFPLTIRRWEKGDFFYPSGMGGKKKLSKYFKDEKLSLVAKENSWLLCSGKDIVWVIGQRADNRYKPTNTTTERLKITYINATH